MTHRVTVDSQTKINKIKKYTDKHSVQRMDDMTKNSVNTEYLC